MNRLRTFITLLYTLTPPTPHLWTAGRALGGWHELGLTFSSDPVAPQGFTDVLLEVQSAEFSFLSELPLALRVGVIQLSGQFLRVLVLLDGSGLVRQTGGL